MAQDEVIRIRIDAQDKVDLAQMYAQQGTTISQAVRTFLKGELQAHRSAVDAFDAIMASADTKLAATGLSEPTIEEINAFVSSIRAERAQQAVLGT